MDNGKSVWKALSWLSFIASSVMLYLGFDKMFVYNNGEYYPHEYHNVYVGGDAYNYIINGNYSTGFFVLATMFAVVGIGFAVLYYLSKVNDTLTAGLSKNIKELVEDREAEETAKKEAERQAEEERKAREQQIAMEKEERFNLYWKEHADERTALINKKNEAAQKLNEIGGLAIAEKRALQDLVNSIEDELTKER